MKFHTPSFFLGAALGIVATFAVLNGGACRPSPTPTDEGTPVSAPMPGKPVADVPIVAPAVPPAAAPVPALAPIKVEVQVEGAPVKPAVVEVPAGAVAAPVSKP